MPDSDLVAVTSLISPFDISMRATEEGLLTMQSRISQWLSNTVNPVRFMAYTRPADLQPRIDYVSRQALMATNRRRKVLLREYRRFYEELQQGSNYQNLVAAIVNWVERGQNESTIARSVENTFQSPARLGSIPPLFHGRYKISPPNDAFRYWHMTPTGRPGGRKYWCLLVSHEFKPVQWNFFKPFGKLMSQDIELSVAIDVPKTFDRDEAISRLEQVMLAYDVHLSTKSDVPDSRSEKKMRDTPRHTRSSQRRTGAASGAGHHRSLRQRFA